MSETQTPMTGHLEPQAEELGRQLHSLATGGNRVSDAALVTPMLLSVAVSLKRLADHFTPPPDQRVGGFSQAEHNLDDMLKDRLHDFAHDMRKD